MPALVLFIIAALVLRVATYGSTIPNIAPIAAIAVCGGLFLAKRSHAVWLTFGALLGADIIISFRVMVDYPDQSLGAIFLSPSFLVRYLAYGLILVGAWALHQKRSAGLALGVTPAASLLFYVMSNTAAWAQSPLYAKSLAGWWQSQTVGLPGFLPSYVFLRNAMIADFVFTLSFVAVTLWLPIWQKQRAGKLVTADSGQLVDR